LYLKGVVFGQILCSVTDLSSSADTLKLAWEKIAPRDNHIYTGSCVWINVGTRHIIQ